MTTETLTPMQKELFDRADQIFIAIKESVATAKDFAIEQLPDIATQFIVYSRTVLSVQMGIAVLILLAGLIIFIYSLRRVIIDGFEYFIMAMISGVVSLAGFLSITNILKDFIMVWFAPKIYIILQLSTLIRCN